MRNTEEDLSQARQLAADRKAALAVLKEQNDALRAENAKLKDQIKAKAVAIVTLKEKP